MKGYKYCMLDGPWMLHMNFPVDDAFHPQSNRFVEGMKITASGDLKHGCPGYIVRNLRKINCFIN